MNHPITITVLLSLLLAVRLTAPTDLLEGDQEKQVGYVMDILENGHWVVQYEIDGRVATKPPVYNWIAAGFCSLFGTREEWVIKLPSLLAGIGLLINLYLLGRHFLDERAAWLACLTCISSHHFTKLVWFARTDMLLACGVLTWITIRTIQRDSSSRGILLGGLLGFIALIKGPVGPILCAIYEGVYRFNQKSPWKPLNRGVWAGIGIFLLICGTYLLVALQDQEFVHRTLRWQLVDRMQDPDLIKPFFYYLPHVFTRIAPWTFVAVATCWLSRTRKERETVDLLIIWAIGSLFFFSLIPVKRHDHLLPVYPPIYLLAGLGLRYGFEPIVQHISKWLIYPACASLILAGALVAGRDSGVTCLLSLGTLVCGIAGILFHFRGYRLCLPAIACGLIFGHGVYHHSIHAEGRSDYADLDRFIDAIRSHAEDEDEVVVFQAHPLIAYELGQHRSLHHISTLNGIETKWLVVPDYWEEEIEQNLGWQLEPLADMTLLPRAHRATLYRVEPAEKVLSRRLEGGVR